MSRLVAAVSLVFVPALAIADGGAVQLSQPSGKCQITLMTDPTPLRVGTIDVSVMIQKGPRGDIVNSGRAMVHMRQLDEPPLTVQSEATSAAATNKLLRMAQLDVPRPGRWELEVELAGAGTPASVRTVVQVADSPPHWRHLAGWIFAPVIPIGLYAIGELLAARRDPRPRRAKLES